MIPCLGVKGIVETEVRGMLDVTEQLADTCQIRVLVVNDACPQESWHEFLPHPQVQVLHRAQNRGVKSATLTGLDEGMEQH